MPVALLGPNVLQTLLQGNGRVTLANRAPASTGVLILAAAIVRHDTTGTSSRQAVWELDIAFGEAQSVEAFDASDQLFAGLEVMIRIFSADQHGLRDVYLASPPGSAPARQWEVGIRPDTTAVETGDFVAPESPGLVGYIRPVR